MLWVRVNRQAEQSEHISIQTNERPPVTKGMCPNHHVYRTDKQLQSSDNQKDWAVSWQDMGKASKKEYFSLYDKFY